MFHASFSPTKPMQPVNRAVPLKDPSLPIGAFPLLEP